MYVPSDERYSRMRYRRCGRSGLRLPAISLGLWRGLGDDTPFDAQQRLLRAAFDRGITHFDLAGCYGPPRGAAERNFGAHMARDWHAHRDELILSTQAGYGLRPGDRGDRKSLIGSLDASLKRMRVDYVDIFYHHGPDPDAPIGETMDALDRIVRSGRALYIGVVNYGPGLAEAAIRALRALGTPLRVFQRRGSMFARDPLASGLGETLRREGVGCVVYAPPLGGTAEGRFLNGVPEDACAVRDPRFLEPEVVTEGVFGKALRLNAIAAARGQTLPQLALQWALRDETVASALIEANDPEQVVRGVAALDLDPLTAEEQARIDAILLERSGGIR